MSDDGRHDRVIKRSLVQGMLPPEHNVVLNLPARMQEIPEARAEAQRFLKETPGLVGFWVDEFGVPTAI